MVNIEKLLKKHPKWKNLMIDYCEYDKDITFNSVELLFVKINKYKPIFNDLYKFAETNLSNHISNKNDKINNLSLLEKFNDKVDYDIQEHIISNFIKSLKTKSYKHLITDEIEDEIKTIISNKISPNLLKNQFFNKIAKFKTSNELLENIIEFKNKNIQWSKEFYLNKIKSLNVDVIEEKECSLMLRPNDYESCREIGSQAWCIVTSKSYFKKYTEEKLREQYRK